MSNRTATFLIASVLAGACLGTVSPGVARAADDCLAAPKGASPEGSHWFYRIDHATKRHCWYLGQRDKHSQTASRSTRSEKSTAAIKTEDSTSRSIANAHAELPVSTGAEQLNQDDAATAAAAQPTLATENAGATAAPGADARGSVVASRWPEFPPAGIAASPPPAMAKLASNLSPESAAASPPAVAAVPLAAADTPRQAGSGSIVMLLAVITGALALAGVIASVVFKFGGIRRLLEPKVRPRHGSIWDRTDDESVKPFSVLSFAHAEEDASTDFGPGFDPRDNRRERVAEFFTQLSKRAPT
jgi:hypothetical protein